ncbi:hypothetical protein CspHIS471_0100110 [Cutaneotrichosporon sp. HIS471]|nr:hypothetical protein CspHIS471_0100110 [Cutaneotrichosporon sp. HIS471]
MLPKEDDRSPERPVDDPAVDWWTALRQNKRITFLILAVQSNAMIMGVEYSLQGTVLGIDSFLKMMGHPSKDGWAIDSDVMATWSALWPSFQLNIGTLIASFVPFAATRSFGAESEKAFRVPLYVALALPTIAVIAELCVLVESPWWLYLHGRRDEARAVLLRLRPDGEAAFEDMKRTIADSQHQTTSSYSDLFRRENK